MLFCAHTFAPVYSVECCSIGYQLIRIVLARSDCFRCLGYGHSSIVYKRRLFVLFGWLFSGGVHTGSVDVWSTHAGTPTTWRQEPGPGFSTTVNPRDRGFMAATVAAGWLIIAGGTHQATTH